MVLRATRAVMKTIWNHAGISSCSKARITANIFRDSDKSNCEG